MEGRVIGGVLRVLAPYRISEEKIGKIAKKFLRSIRKKEKRKESNSSLAKRAKIINKKYFQGKLKDFSIIWSPRQKKRLFGVCDHKKREIRITARVKKAPAWVQDYLLIHELAHLMERNHGKNFWRLVKQFKKTSEAKAFLKGMDYWREQTENER